MIKVVFCLRKRPDMSKEAFFAYWNGNHAAIARDVRGVIGVRRYVQNLAVHPEISDASAQERGSPPAYDGMAEAWFDNIDTLTRAMTSPEGQAGFKRLLDDEYNFIDLKQSPFFLVEEHEIF